MNDPIDSAEAPAGSGDGAATDAPTAAVRQLYPRPAEDPTSAAVGAPLGRPSRYRRRDVSGSRWRFTGRVEYVSGAEAKRLRGELAVVVRDLLAWASEHRDADDSSRPATGSIEDGEAA